MTDVVENPTDSPMLQASSYSLRLLEYDILIIGTTCIEMVHSGSSRDFVKLYNQVWKCEVD